MLVGRRRRSQPPSGRLVPVEEVISGIRYECLVTDVREQVTTDRRRQPSSGIQPLKKRRAGQRTAAGRAWLGTNDFELEPGNRLRIDGGGSHQLRPDRARISRVLPRDAHQVALVRVRTEEMGGELAALIVEQRRLRRKQHPTDTSKWTC